MPQQILLIQGAGAGAYDEDAKLAESLRSELGPDYEVIYPAMPDENNAPYDQWKQCAQNELANTHGPVIFAGHSVGGSFLLKFLGETTLQAPIAGVFIMAAPYWGGDGWLYDGYEQLELPEGIASKLPKEIPLDLYHCKDDDTVPSRHMELFKKRLPHAATHLLDNGGHQLNGGLTAVAQDIKAIKF